MNTEEARKGLEERIQAERKHLDTVDRLQADGIDVSFVSGSSLFLRTQTLDDWKALLPRLRSYLGNYTLANYYMGGFCDNQLVIRYNFSDVGAVIFITPEDTHEALRLVSQGKCRITLEKPCQKQTIVCSV